MTLYHCIEMYVFFYCMHLKADQLCWSSCFCLQTNLLDWQVYSFFSLLLLAIVHSFHTFFKVHILFDVTSFITVLLGGAGGRNSTARFHILQKATGFASRDIFQES